MYKPSHLRQTKPLIYGLFFACILAGCAAAGAVSTAIQVAANMAGIKKSPPDYNATKDIPLKIQADKLLNSDAKKNSFALVVRIYHLKQSASFQQAFYDIFLAPDKENEMLGMDVISKKEITLVPGQMYSNIEKLNLSTESIGVVAFFQKPAASRWKLTFPVKNIDQGGVSLNLGGCSISVLSGNTLEFGAGQQSTLKTPANCG